MRRPPGVQRVDVYMPTRGRPHVRALGAAQAIAARSGGRLHVVAGEPVTRARNHCVRGLLASATEWMLFLDDDVIPQRPDTAQRLLRLQADLASGVVPFWDADRRRMIVAVARDGTGWLTPWPRGRFALVHAGTACLLVHRRVFEALGFPWFQWYEARDPRRDGQITELGEDVLFSARAREAGFRIMCDASVRCDHLKELSLLSLCDGAPRRRR